MRLRFLLIGACWLLTCLSSGATWGQDSSAENPLSDRWEAGLTFDVMLYNWESSASVESSVPELNGSQSTEFDSVQYQVGLDVMTPRMGFLPAAPRAWLFGGALVSPQDTHAPFQKGEFIPRMPETLLDRWEMSGFVPPDTSFFQGQGSQVEARYLEGGWYVGLGAVFELPFRNSMVRLKPFVGYLRQRIEVSGKIVGVFPVEDPDVYPYAILRANAPWQRQTQHFLGPGGEVELVLIPGSSVAFSIYGQAQFLWNLSLSSIAMEADNTVLTPGVPTETVRFTYTPDHFAVRGVMGARLSWRGGFSF